MRNENRRLNYDIYLVDIINLLESFKRDKWDIKELIDLPEDNELVNYIAILEDLREELK